MFSTVTSRKPPSKPESDSSAFGNTQQRFSLHTTITPNSARLYSERVPDQTTLPAEAVVVFVHFIIVGNMPELRRP